MRKILTSLTSSTGLRSAALMTFGNTASTMLSAVAMIIFSRLLGPTEFGIFSVLFSLMLILTKIGDLGLNIAVQREIAQHPDEDKLVSRTIATGSYFKLLITGLLVVVGILGGKYLGAEWLKLGEFSYLSSWVFLAVGIIIFYEYIIIVLQGKGKFGTSLAMNFVQSLGKLFFALFFLSTSLSLRAITLIYLLVPLTSVVFSFRRIPLSVYKPVLNRDTGQKVLQIAKWTSISILASTLADNLDVILVQNFLSSYDTGLWSAAVKMSLLLSMAAISLGSVLNVRVAAYSNPDNLHKYLKKAIMIAVFGMVAVTMLAPFSVPLLQYTVGSEFIPAASSMVLLIYSTAILMATVPFVALFYLFDRPAYFALSGILGTAVLIIANLFMIPTLGIMGAGYARIISRLTVLIFTLIFAYYAYRDHLKKVEPSSP